MPTNAQSVRGRATVLKSRDGTSVCIFDPKQLIRIMGWSCAMTVESLPIEEAWCAFERRIENFNPIQDAPIKGPVIGFEG
jgi:hypothetical protein